MADHDPRDNVVPHPGAAADPWAGLPHNGEAEKALLGAVLLNNQAYHRACEGLEPEHFFEPAHARIYAAIARAIDSGGTASPPMLAAEFAKDDGLANVGGHKYLGHLAASAATVIAAPDYAKTITDLYQRRALIQTCEGVAAEARGHDKTNDELLEYLDGETYPMATANGAPAPAEMDAAIAGALEWADEAYRREGTVSGVTTGLVGLDRKLSGMQDGELIVLAGRPSMGKSDTAINITTAAAMAMGHAERALFFSLEMPKEMIGQRLLAKITGISAHRQRAGDLSPGDFEALLAGQRELAGLPITIDDWGNSSVSRMRGMARRIERQGARCRLIVVDYLQRMPWPRDRRDENSALTEITKGLKDLAMEMKCPLLLVSQLSRAVEGRDNKRPQMSDLRGSGAIEQDADAIIFVYRDEYYLTRNEPADQDSAAWDKWQGALARSRGTMDLILAKQRCGPEGTVTVNYSGELSQLQDLDQCEMGGGF